jgi:SulP family sulfate permease
VLVPYGSLFFAAAPVLDKQLPEITDDLRQAVVILVLRGRQNVGSTLLMVLTRYAELLREQGSRLMLAGVDLQVREQIERTGVIHAIGAGNIFLKDDSLGQALQEAVDAAEAWISQQSESATTRNRTEPS